MNCVSQKPLSFIIIKEYYAKSLVDKEENMEVIITVFELVWSAILSINYNKNWKYWKQLKKLKTTENITILCIYVSLIQSFS